MRKKKRILNDITMTYIVPLKKSSEYWVYYCQAQ